VVERTGDGVARWFGPLIWVCCVCGAGCGFDRSPLKGEGLVGSPVQGGDGNQHGGSGASHGSSGSGGSVSTMHSGGSGGSHAGGSGGSTAMPDAAVVMHDASTPAAQDSGAMHSGSGGHAPDNTPDTGTPDAGKPSQTPDAGIIPGTYTPCNGNDDTTTCPDGWKCYGGQPNTPGHCAEACTKDTDCTDYDGFDFTCFADDGKCRIDCGSSGSMGACPDELTCVLDLTNNYRCRFPPTSTSGTRTLYQSCVIEKGDADCVSGLHCYLADGFGLQGPGYCTTSCGPQGGGPGPGGGQGPQCYNPSDVGTVDCAGGFCRFDCSHDDCPDGMDCAMVQDVGVCHYTP
jgi:hypothetical protein